MAIVFGCKKFQHYLLGKADVVAETDHKPLEVILVKSLLTAPNRLQKMMLRLQRFDLNVHYRPGKEMYIADLLCHVHRRVKS